uniref:Uncharacterized protein n=1 Tax=Denticeps clupeoides TaxID=299321 RepID=A0AAY4CW35_9TELE
VLEDEQPEHVRPQTQTPDHQHQRRVRDGLRPGEALQRLHRHRDAEPHQEHGVGQRPDHLGPGQPVGGAARAGAPRQPGRRQADAQRHEVGQHVEGVRHQRDGVAHVARHDLRHEQHDGDDEHEDQSPWGHHGRKWGSNPGLCGLPDSQAP